MIAPFTAGRTLPHDIEAEEGLLSVCFLDGPTTLAKAIVSGIRPDSFYDSRHEIIFQVLLDLYSSQQSCEIDLVATELKARRQLDQIGGWSVLSQVGSRMPTTAAANKLIQTVRAYALLRAMIRSRTGSVDDCYAWDGDDIDAFVSRLQAREATATALSATQGEETVQEVVKALRADFARPRGQRKGMAGTVSWGLVDMDHACGKMQPGDLIILGGAPGSGKAQPLATPILTPKGYVPMGSLTVGDYVIGLDGQPTQIIAIHPQGRKPVFRVTMSDDTSTLCCSDHLWLTQTRTERVRGCSGTVKTLSDVSRTIHRNDGSKRNHVLPQIAPVEFEPQPERLPLHPWLLGALLGDGKLANGNVLFSKPEKDVQEKVISLIPAEDTVSRYRDDDVRIKRRKRNNRKSATRQIIDRLGLAVHSEKKFIPEAYLYATPKERMELLCGLVDTDGSCDETAVEYSTSSERLMDGVAFLVRSLGGICRVTSRIPKYYHQGMKKNGARSWRALIWFLDGRIPATSEKHLKRMRAGHIRHVWRSIVSIIPEGDVECQCITVAAPNGIYVTNDFIPTHNSALSDSVAWGVASSGRHAAIFTYEMAPAQKILRIVQQQARLNEDQYDAAPEDLRREYLRMLDSVGSCKTLHIFKNDRTLSRLLARCRMLHQKAPLSLVVVDFLQYLSRHEPSIERERTDEKIGRISAGLKALATDCNCPVLLLSSLNRSGYANGAQPSLASFKNSGEIESDADVALILKWPDKNPHTGQLQDPKDEHQNTFLVTCDQEKGRYKGVHRVELMFTRNITRFDNCQR